MDDREIITAAIEASYDVDQRGDITNLHQVAGAVLAHLEASGRAIVPVEATAEMENAACDLWWLDFEGDEEVYLRVTAHQAHEIYRAMIAAAKDQTDGR